MVVVERREAARVLGVPSQAAPATVDRAFRRRARDAHPDRYPPGSEAAQEATERMQRLVEARRVLGLPTPPLTTHPGEDGTWAWAKDAPGQTPDEEWFLSAGDADRRVRLWGLSWGFFLVLSAVASFVVGSASTPNDALPLWSPALALTGVVVIVIGLRAHARLTRRP